MFCPKCGHKVSEGNKFCGNCGAALYTRVLRQVVAVPSPTLPPRRRFKWWHWLIVGWLVVAVLACVIIYAVTVNYPEYKAGQTATAIAAATRAAGPTDTPEPTSMPRPTSTPRPSNTPRSTNTPAPPTATLLPEQACAAIAQDVLGSDVLTVTLESTAVTIDYDLGFQWDESSAVRTAIRNLVRLAPQIFTAVDTDALALNAYADFTDAYGNTRRGRALGFMITREVDSKINWQDFNTHNTDYILTTEPDCGLFVHPALRQAWNEYAAER